MSDNKLEQYLLNRGVDIMDRAKPLEIINDKELLTRVAGAWSANKDEIRLVVRARCEKLRHQLIFTALPQETVVLRQALAEVAGILDDFENISDKYGAIKETETEDNADKTGVKTADRGE